MDSENNGFGTTMLVSPASSVPMYQGGGFGNGGFGGDWAWILLLLVLFGNNGWGNGGFGGGAWGGDGLYPWMNNSQNINNGFRDQMLNTQITSIGDKLVSGFGDITTQLCNGFNGTQMSILQSVNGLQSQLAQCCCDNRLATCQTQNVIATESAATRANATANTQAILDKLCQLELDGYKREVDSLRGQLTDAKLKASQVEQNAFIAQGLNNEVDALYNRLSNCPVPSTPVYGRTPIFTCNNNGCGCGCGG